jgi:hypothetical protein
MSNLSSFERSPSTHSGTRAHTGMSDDVLVDENPGFVLTPEQAQIMDLLEGRVQARVQPTAAQAEATAGQGGMQRDIVLATLGATTLTAGLVAIFFMAAMGAVLLVVGALLCVAAYEHAISADAANILAASRDELGRSEALHDDAEQTLI